MVPNLLNLPFSVFGFGAAPADLMGLGMYVASRTAECPYCSAHTCSFALRRGASPEKVAQALVGGSGTFSPRELATIAVARSLGRIPCELTDAERNALQQHLGPDAAEWVVCGVVMMGFLNKFMDAIGVELESSTFAETRALMGAEWAPGKAGRDLDRSLGPAPAPSADSLWTKARIVPLAPAALRLDREWQQGVPDSWPAVGGWLRERTGHEFPVLSRLRAKRVVRAVATMLRDNLDPTTSVIGLEAKILAGAIFAAVIEDESLLAEIRLLAVRQHIPPESLDVAVQYGRAAGDLPPAIDHRTATLLRLARAASPSPARIDAAVVAECRENQLSSAGVVELITWLAVLQMMHRLTSYFAAPAH
jgi:alkylhydroperoxidase family enzyme